MATPLLTTKLSPLKFDPADANQGIFFVAEDGSATRMDIAGRNKPSELMFMLVLSKSACT